MKLRLRRGMLLVRRSTQVETTKSGILLAVSAQERPQTGTVIALGAGSDLAVGALVLLPIFHTKHIWLDGERLDFITEDEVLAELTPSASTRETNDEH